MPLLEISNEITLDRVSKLAGTFQLSKLRSVQSLIFRHISNVFNKNNNKFLNRPRQRTLPVRTAPWLTFEVNLEVL
jgi:hypothetical protein